MVEPRKVWNEEEELFYDIPGATLHLQHNLVSISKWEARWKRAYLKEGEKSFEETLDYIRCMTQEDDIPDEVYLGISDEDILRITKYIDDPMTATHFNDPDMNNPQSKFGGDTVTSELVYYWMSAFNLPHEYETWHFNRLMTLLKVCSVKNQKPKHMSQAEIAARNRALNAQRKARTKSRG